LMRFDDIHLLERVPMNLKELAFIVSAGHAVWSG
jgi:hypothetical protein